MSLQSILKPNGYNLFANSITASGGVFTSDIVYHTLRQDNNLGPAVDAAGAMTSAGSINVNGNVNAVTGLTTPASVSAGIQVEAPLLNATNQIVAVNNISSVNGAVTGKTFNNNSSGFVVSSSGDIICKNFNASGVANIALFCNALGFTGTYGSFGDQVTHSGSVAVNTNNYTQYRQLVSYAADTTLAAIDVNGVVLNANVGGTPTFTLPDANLIQPAISLATPLVVGDVFSFLLVCDTSSTSVALANSAGGTTILYQPITVLSGVSRMIYARCQNTDVTASGAIVLY